MSQLTNSESEGLLACALRGTLAEALEMILVQSSLQGTEVPKLCFLRVQAPIPLPQVSAMSAVPTCQPEGSWRGSSSQREIPFTLNVLWRRQILPHVPDPLTEKMFSIQNVSCWGSF